jgi:hypothetical protein
VRILEEQETKEAERRFRACVSEDGRGKEGHACIPVMSSQDNLLAAKLSRKLGNVVADPLVAVVFQSIRWRILSTWFSINYFSHSDLNTYRSPITHAIRRHDAKAHLQERGDLVAPSHRYIREAMDLIRSSSIRYPRRRKVTQRSPETVFPWACLWARRRDILRDWSAVHKARWGICKTREQYA